MHSLTKLGMQSEKICILSSVGRAFGFYPKSHRFDPCRMHNKICIHGSIGRASDF